MNKIKDLALSEKGMAIINFFFFVLMVFHSDKLGFCLSLMWIIFLVISIFKTNHVIMKILYILFCSPIFILFFVNCVMVVQSFLTY